MQIQRSTQATGLPCPEPPRETRIGPLELMIAAFVVFALFAVIYRLGKGAGFREGLREGERMRSRAEKP